MTIKISRFSPLQGTIAIPGDKSITHRAFILAAIAKGKSIITHFSNCSDCTSTAKILQKLGVSFQYESKTVKDRLIITGISNIEQFLHVNDFLDCENSGTTARLMLGMLSAIPSSYTLNGDESLIRRPMKRVTDPLQKMGADFSFSDRTGCLPVQITGKKQLRECNFTLNVASAQVKSAMLIAAAHAKSALKIVSPWLLRDHTERLLKKMGAPIIFDNMDINLKPDSVLEGCEINIPGDFSSAAFFIARAAVEPGSRIIIKNVGLNQTRTAFLNILRRMGSEIRILNFFNDSFEPYGDIEIRGARLKATDLMPEEIPALIDEIPVIAFAMACADGVSNVSGATELRIKESDRISAIVREFSKFNVKIIEKHDGFIIDGPSKFVSPDKPFIHNDHRIVMTASIMATMADGTTEIQNTEAADVSYPSFFTDLDLFRENPQTP
ncbi:MAG: 3-phosphoshikimate 1-carboxyvinyltransferase [Candidatus Riflebacteria bacterium]|nr:3-phosphoshikimate 1-carboxyvinyltransferase [Candidatus Riflebacteria bacterium]